MLTSRTPDPFRAHNERMRVRIKTAMVAFKTVGYWSESAGATTLEAAVFASDPFQARTLPVFESIYRYGRETLS